MKQWKLPYESIYDGEMGVNQASREYGVPTTTLRDCINEKVTHGTPMGARPCLSQAEEKKLENFLFATLCVGFSKTRAHVMMYAEKVARGINLRSHNSSMV